MQTLYSNMEALVFDEAGTVLEDTTLPDINRQDSKLQSYMDDLTTAFGKVFLFDLSTLLFGGLMNSLVYFLQETPAAKRSAPAAPGEGGRTKAAKNNLTNGEIEEAVRNGQVSKRIYHIKRSIYSSCIIPIITFIIAANRYRSEPQRLFEESRPAVSR